MSGGTAIALALFLPLAGAFGIVLVGRWPNLREGVTLVTAVALFLIVGSLYGPVTEGVRPALALLSVAPGLPLVFEVEPLGMLFGLIASFLWIVNSVYSIGYMRAKQEHNQTRFYACFAIAISSALGVAFAGNMFTLFIFYEVLTLSTYPLVTHAGTPAALKGGRTYLGILLFTSIGLQLVALVGTWAVAGTTDFADGGILAGTASDLVLSALLLLYVFGIGKAALMPFHRWLPAAMVAPTPVSALLHAVAVVKAGVFTVLKVALYVFGLDLVRTLAAGEFLTYVAAATILLASLIAMRQDNLKRRLAYSTVSQLSYIVVGAMMANGVAVMGAGLHLLMHAFGKITLFFCAGAIDAAHKTKEISKMRGIGRAMPFTMAAFFVASMSIIGLPLAGGMWSKWYLGLGSLESHHYVVLAALLISSLLNIAYLLPIPVRAFFASDEERAVWGPGIKEAPWLCVGALGFTALASVALFFFPGPFYRLLSLIPGLGS
ncbi:MAG: proton-conducting transporter membrane subunit [Proteobacteria bacterium]|nr:proton-conducting transporter membrane subunit [Pseudomonadota bacterium]